MNCHNSIFRVFYENSQSQSFDEFRIRILCFLFYLGKKISFYELGEKFGTCASNAYKWCVCIMNIILKRKDEFIYLPEFSEFQMLSERFSRVSSLTGTILAIDGTHVPIRRPKQNHSRYINRKGFFSLNFLVAADSNFKIRYVYGGTFGSSHDSFVYNASSLSDWTVENLNVTSFHITGDSAYPSKPYLLTPFKGVLNNEERMHNNRLIPQRDIIERTFGQFKMKFQKFRFENTSENGLNISKMFFQRPFFIILLWI